MRPKNYALILACVVLGGSAFALWRWAGSTQRAQGPLPVYDPVEYPQAAAVNAALEGHSPAQQDVLIYPLVSGLAAQGLCEVLEQSQALRPQSRDLVLSALCLRLGEIAPEQGWAALQKVSPFPTAAAKALFIGWSARDFAAAQEAVNALASRDRRSQLAAALLAAYAEKFPAQAAAFAVADPYDPKTVGLDQILLLWSYKDRPAALAFALEHNRPKALDALFIHWFSADRAEAIAGLLQIPEKPRQELLDALWDDDAFIAADTDLTRTLLQKFPDKRTNVQEERYFEYLKARLVANRLSAIAEVLALTDQWLQRRAMEQVVVTLAKIDPAAAFEILLAYRQVASEENFNGLLSGSLWSLSDKDPMEFIAFINRLPSSPETIWLTASAFGHVKPGQFAQARQLLEEMEFNNPGGRERAYKELSEAIARKDRTAAMEWMKNTQDEKLKKQIAQSILEATAESNLSQAISLHKQFSKDLGTSFNIETLIARAKDIGDPQAVLQWTLQNTNSSDKTYAVKSLIESVLGKDRETALSLYRELPEESFKKEVGQSLVSSLEEDSPEEALKLAKTLEDPALVGQLQNRMLTKAIEDDFEGALARLRDPAALEIILPKDNSLGESSGNEFISALMRADADRVWETIQTLPEKGSREKLVALYANELSKTDPQAALDLICENNIQPGQKDFLMVYFNWMQLDPAAGMDWMENRFPDINTHAFYYMQTLNSWLRIDPANASQWLAQQPAGEWRDEMVGMLVEQEKTNDPEAAFRWATTMADASTREKTLVKIYKFWSKSDPMAAQNAINDAAISPQARQAILKQGGNP